MQAKTIEIRDAATFIPALAVRLDPETAADRYLLARAGYGREPAAQARYVLLMRLSGGTGGYSYDPHTWGGNRTMATAHQWLLEHFDEIDSGAVVDVEYLLGLRPTPKTSEALEAIP